MAVGVANRAHDECSPWMLILARRSATRGRTAEARSLTIQRYEAAYAAAGLRVPRGAAGAGRRKCGYMTIAKAIGILKVRFGGVRGERAPKGVRPHRADSLYGNKRRNDERGRTHLRDASRQSAWRSTLGYMVKRLSASGGCLGS
jgi:hypothetical protein